MERSLRDTTLEPALLEAYRETHYEVDGPRPIVLRVGERCEPLAELMAAEGASCAAFITAFNPFSEPLGDEENEALLGSLRGSLTGAGWTLFEGQGRHPSGEWAPESSLLILGMERGEAAELGARWRQNAVVWVGAGAVPELVLLR